MPDNNRKILEDAIARNCSVVLSLPSAGLLRHQKSRFLSEAPAGIWLEASAAEFPLVQELIGSGKPAGVSFKNGQTKVVFASPILEKDAEYRINAETTASAVLIAFPSDIKAIQRRGTYRVRIVDGSELSAKIWRIAPRVSVNDRPMPTAELAFIFRDLSIGGMGVTFLGQDGAPPKVSTEDRLRIEIRFREAAILVEGRMRKPANTENPQQLFTGVQFKDMASDIEGRQKLSQLTRIIGELQREEVRRGRLGVG